MPQQSTPSFRLFQDPKDSFPKQLGLSAILKTEPQETSSGASQGYSTLSNSNNAADDETKGDRFSDESSDKYSDESSDESSEESSILNVPK